VFGFLQAGTWGWLVPKNSPVEPLGFSLTPFMVVGGLCVLVLFKWWERRRVEHGDDPLFKLELLEIPTLRAGLESFGAQNLILMGVFFSIPLYLQLVLGLNALDTGLKMLPISITMFLASAAGAQLSSRFTVRAIVRSGIVVTALAIVALLVTLQPTLADTMFGIAMGTLGIGMGLMVSQLGNVVQSSVDASGRGEAGGLQFTGQQLGSSLGVALVGAIVLSGLASSFVSNVQQDERISEELAASLTSIAEASGADFVSADVVLSASLDAGLDEATSQAIVENYSEAQLLALKAGLLATALLALAALAFTGDLPHDPPTARRRTQRESSVP